MNTKQTSSRYDNETGRKLSMGERYADAISQPVTDSGKAPSEPFTPTMRYGVQGDFGTHFCRTLEEAKTFAKSGKAGNPRHAKPFSQQGSFQRNYNV